MKRKNKGSLKSKVAEIIMTSGRQDVQCLGEELLCVLNLDLYDFRKFFNFSMS